MHIQSDQQMTVVRLYDRVQDNPNELNLVRLADGRVDVGIEDRDSGNNELHIAVNVSELRAALAVLESTDDAPVSVSE